MIKYPSVQVARQYQARSQFRGMLFYGVVLAVTFYWFQDRLMPILRQLEDVTIR